MQDSNQVSQSVSQNGSVVDSINKIIFYIGAGYLFLFPLFFLTQTSEFTEYNKLFLTIFVASIFLVLWGLKTLMLKKLSVTKTPLDASLVVLVISVALGTFFAVNRNVSIFGSFNVWHMIGIEILSFVIIFYVLLSSIKDKNHIRGLELAFFSSTFLLAVLAVLVYFNVFDSVTLPASLEVLKVNGFSPAGSAKSLIVTLLSGLFMGIFVLRDSGRVVDQSMKISFAAMTVTIGLGLTLWLGAFIPGIQSRTLPSAQLNFDTSWRIAISSVRDYPWFGVGPSNYSYAYNLYKPSALNRTDSWALVFNNSGSEYMTWLTTVGLVGFFALLFFVFRVIVAARASIAKSNGNTENNRTPYMVAVLGLLLLYLFMSSTVMTTGLFFILLTLWMLYEKFENNESIEDVEISLAAVNTRVGTNNSYQILPWIVATPMIALAGVLFYYSVQDFRSNIAYAESVQAINQNQTAQEIYDAQSLAINLNPRRDVYHRAYAETSLRLAEVIAEQRGESITETEREDIVTLISNAIRETRITTELVNPSSSNNWRARGNIYRRLLGVANGADRWALHGFQQARILAPNDPRLLLDIGRLYYSLAVSESPAEGEAGQAPGSEIPDVPETKQARLIQAEQALLQALAQRPDYGAARFQLGVVYLEAGNNDLARQEFERAQSLFTEGSVDYQRVQQLLDTLPPATDSSVEE